MSTRTFVPSCGATLLLALSLTLASTGATPTPTPERTPTPRPGTLAAYARDLPLQRSGATAPGAPLLITTGDLAALGADGALTVAGEASSAPPASATPLQTPDPAVRERWRRRYAAKSAAVHRIEDRRTALLADLHRLEDGRFTARTLARIDRIEAVLNGLDDELRRAERALAAVVRAARKEGAEPGWFRDL